MQTRNPPSAYVGKTTEDGVGIREKGNADGWIYAEYRDGWWQRTLLSGDDEYAEMTHPFYQRCWACGQWLTTMRWSAGSAFCPACEQGLHYRMDNHRDAEGYDA